ncbi:MAG: TolB family protein, partial [Gemmatimonadales bacterium]
MHARRFFVVAALLLCPRQAGHAQAAAADEAPTRALELADFARMRSLQDIVAAPDGKSAVLRIGTVDTLTDRYTSDLWSLDLDSGALRRLTSHPGTEYGPRFSPDGRTLGFLAARGERTQVFGLSLDGGDARPLFDFAGEVQEFS